MSFVGTELWTIVCYSKMPQSRAQFITDPLENLQIATTVSSLLPHEVPAGTYKTFLQITELYTFVQDIANIWRLSNATSKMLLFFTVRRDLLIIDDDFQGVIYIYFLCAKQSG